MRYFRFGIGKSVAAKVLAICLMLLFLVLLILSGPTANVTAGSRYFTVVQEICDVKVEKDGGAWIEYSFTIKNGGDPLTDLDVRMPNTRFELDGSAASISGVYISSSAISESTRYEDAVHIDLSTNPINTNSISTVWLKVYDPIIALEDDKYEDYSVIEFTPAWFTEDETVLTEELIFRIHLPSGTDAGSIFTLGDEPDTIETAPTGEVIVTWEYTDINWAREGPNKDLGVRAPSKNVEGHSRFWSLTIYEFFEGLNIIALVIGAVIMIGLVIAAVIIVKKAFKKREAYVSPMMMKEASKIDYTLTPEAFAYLNGAPPQRVMALLLYRTVKEGGTNLVERFPIELKRTTKRAPYGKKNPFANPKNGTLDPKTVAAFFRMLDIEQKERLRSFDLDDTLTFYQERIDKAWDKLKRATEPASQMQVMDKEFIWMVQDKGFKKKWNQISEKREEMTIPEWLFIMSYDEESYETTISRPRTKKEDEFIKLLMERPTSIFNQAGVIEPTKELGKALLFSFIDFIDEISETKGVGKVLNNTPRFRPEGSRKKHLRPKDLPDINKRAYIKFRGGS